MNFDNINTEALAYITSGDKAFEVDNYSQAIAYYTKAIELDPSNRYPLSKRGKCYQMTQQYDKALIDLFKSKDLDDNFENNQSIAECYLFKKDFSKAVQFFDTAIEQIEEIESIDTDKMMGIDYAATKARALNNQATCYYNLKQFRQAVEKSNLAISLNPTYSNPLFIRGCIYIALEKFEAAVDDFTLFKRLGNSHTGLGDLETLAKGKSSAFFADFFKEIKRSSNDTSNQRDANIQINAFKQDLLEDIQEIDVTKSYFGNFDTYERKVLKCKEYFNRLWETVDNSRSTDGFMGFICYNIARAVEIIDPRINSYEFFIDLFKKVYEPK